MKEKKADQNIGIKSAKFLVLIIILSFIIFLISAFVWFPRTGILPSIKGQFVVLQAASNFLTFFPIIFISFILITTAIFPAFFEKSTISFSSIGTFIILVMMVFTALNEIAHPIITKRIENIDYITQSGNDLIKAAYEAEKNGNLSQAYDNFSRYVELNPSNMNAIREFDRIKKELAAEKNKKSQTAMEEEGNGSSRDPGRTFSAESAFQLARELFQEEQYNDSYFFASLAIQLGKKDAEQIRDAAWEKIATVKPDEEKLTFSNLFTEKAEGLSDLSYGNSIAAYYQFLELQEQFPRDNEVKNLLSKAKENLTNIAFYYDDAVQALTYPGYQDLFFVLSTTEQEIELIYAEAAVMTTEAMYFKNFEYMSIDKEQKTINMHYLVPFVKSIGETLLFTCLHRTDQDIRFVPNIITGSANASIPRKMELPVAIDDVEYFSRTLSNMNLLSVGEIMYLRDLWPQFGYRYEPLIIELLMRIGYPFIFLVFSFFSLSIGLRTKKQGGGITPFAYLFMPLIPIVMYYIVHFFYYVNKLFLSFMYLWAGFGLTLLFFVIIQGALLAIAISRSMKKITTPSPV